MQIEIVIGNIVRGECMSSATVVNSPGINLIPNIDKSVPIEIRIAYESYFADKDYGRLRSYLESQEPIYNKLCFQEILWNYKNSDYADSRTLIRLLAEDKIPRSDWDLNIGLLSEMGKTLYFRMAYTDPEFLSILKLASGFGWGVRSGDHSELFYADSADLLSVKNLRDFKYWLKFTRAEFNGRYPDIGTAHVIYFASKYPEKFLRLALQIDASNCEVFFSRKILSSLDTPEASGYFLMLSYGPVEAGHYELPSVASVAFFVADSFAELAQHLISASTVTASVILICLTFDEYDDSPSWRKEGWYFEKFEHKFDIFIANDKVFYFCAFNDTNPNVVSRRLEDRFRDIGDLHAFSQGPFNFKYSEFGNYDVEGVHSNVIESFGPALYLRLSR